MTGVDADDVDANADIFVVAGGATSTSMSFTVFNLDAANALFLTKVVARASRYTSVPAGTSEASDATSVTVYGKRTYPISPVWLPSLAAANTYRDAVIAAAKDPHPALTLTLDPRAGLDVGAHCFTRELADRVTVTASSWEAPYGLSAVPFFIESIGHRFSRGGHETTYELSAV